MFLAQLCVKRPVFTTMLIMALVVMGWFSYERLGLDLLPKIDRPTITVTTRLVGASPEEMETQVTKDPQPAHGGKFRPGLAPHPGHRGLGPPRPPRDYRVRGQENQAAAGDHPRGGKHHLRGGWEGEGVGQP